MLWCLSSIMYMLYRICNSNTYEMHENNTNCGESCLSHCWAGVFLYSSHLEVSEDCDSLV